MALPYRHWKSGNLSIKNVLTSQTQLGTLCLSETPQRHLISRLYSLLFHSCVVTSGTASAAWERELRVSLSREDREKTCSMTHTYSLNTDTQGHCYKFLIRWYRTPSVLHKCNPAVPDKCGHCDAEGGNMLHFWWECLVLQSFWTQTHAIIEMVSTCRLDFSPLHHTSIATSCYRWFLTLHMVNAAKMCVPVLWRLQMVASLRDGFLRLDRVVEMEKLIYVSQDRYDAVYKTWARWLLYKYNNAYKSIMTRSTPWCT